MIQTQLRLFTTREETLFRKYLLNKKSNLLRPTKESSEQEKSTSNYTKLTSRNEKETTNSRRAWSLNSTVVLKMNGVENLIKTVLLFSSSLITNEKLP
jgi:hypothetical protein